MFAFSASTAFGRAESASQSSKRVIVDKKEICNYGELRYKEFGVTTSLPKVTDEFIGAVLALPIANDVDAYYDFIEDWGTVS